MWGGEVYLRGVRICGGLAWLITFVVTWIACTANYGFLLGFGLGWLPAMILGAIVGAAVGLLWPLIALALLGLGAWAAIYASG